MKEIKFRAWFPNKKGMRFVAMNAVYEVNKSYFYLSPMPMSDYEPIELMQYTGLRDKNGREIYEGDILKIDDDWEKWGFASGFVGYVIYDQGSFKLKEGKIYAPSYRLDSSVEEGATVIGNIFQDGDLLHDS